jgi:hypothetical protein
MGDTPILIRDPSPTAKMEPKGRIKRKTTARNARRSDIEKRKYCHHNMKRNAKIKKSPPEWGDIFYL